MIPENFYKTLIDNICDGVYFVDTELNVTFWNKAAQDISGYTADEMKGRSCREARLSHIDENGHSLCTLGCPLYATVRDGIQRRADVYMRHKEGHRFPVSINVLPIYEDGKITGAVEIFTPGAPVRYEDDLIERLSNLAMSDRLTNAANRRKIETYLDYSFHELKCFKKLFCVLFLDIDNFGLLNNTYGHEAGDKILQSIVRAVEGSMRSSDMFGRWGGEEFVGVFKIAAPKDAVAIAEKVRKLVSDAAIDFEGKTLSVTASIGVTIARENDSIATIVGRADALMYKSKRNNKNCVTSDIK